MVGRWLDAASVAELGARTRLDLAVLPVSSSRRYRAEVREAAASSRGRGTTQRFVIPQNADTVAGYAVLNDLVGQACLGDAGGHAPGHLRSRSVQRAQLHALSPCLV